MSLPLWENSPVGDRSFVGERPSGATFAGRDVELDRLGAALVALDNTGAQTILIGGEAGIGKTRLIEEFRDRARAAGAIVATGVCSPAEGGGLPYGPVMGILRDLARQLDEHTAASVLAPTRQRLSLLDAPSAAANDASATSELGRTHLFEALLDCFIALAERSRVVVVFEDLHWADSASVEVIDFLARNLGGSPLLVVGSFRRDELDPDQSQRASSPSSAATARCPRSSSPGSTRARPRC